MYHISRVVKNKSCLRAGFERRPRRAGRVRRLGAQGVLESLDVRRVGDRVCGLVTVVLALPAPMTPLRVR